ncbi:MAG TPA: IclR family transcriptional regulator [Lentisphaeria bacterium]|mgnify:FL=1|nr:IclR family transcriptional regulator [Lentisphaeria bacterium]
MPQKTYMVPALERGLRILELLAGHPEGLMMNEMNALELPSASLYRMLVTLNELGYIIRDDNDRYRLGRKLLTLGYSSMDEGALAEKAFGPMRELRDRTGETVMLGVLYGTEGVVIESVKSTRAVCVSVRIGHHYPLHTAAPAKAMLAYLPDEERKKILKSIAYTKFTENTIPDADAFERELKDIRKSGIAYDRGEELRELRCAGAPVLNASGYPVAAIWIGGPESRLDETTLCEYGAFVKETAEKITLKITQ